MSLSEAGQLRIDTAFNAVVRLLAVTTNEKATLRDAWLVMMDALDELRRAGAELAGFPLEGQSAIFAGIDRRLIQIHLATAAKALAEAGAGISIGPRGAVQRVDVDGRIGAALEAVDRAVAAFAGRGEPR